MSDWLDSGWSSSIALDTAKLGLLLYLCGLFSFSCYYARFRILSIDFAKPEAILIGIYIVLLFTLAPTFLFSVVLTKIGTEQNNHILFRFSALFLLLLLIDLPFVVYLGYRWLAAVEIAALTTALQTSMLLVIAGVPEDAKLTARLRVLGILAICCVQFSFCWLPRIPAYYGGGQPYEVQVFSKTPNLPANRFFRYKNQPQINKSIDSYKLKLLYQTDKDIYFVDELREGSNSIGYSVMRIKRDEILRMDYETPQWLRW